MENLTSKCESCGYSMVFNPDVQALSCSHCGGTKAIVSVGGTQKREYNTLSTLSKNTNAKAVFDLDI